MSALAAIRAALRSLLLGQATPKPPPKRGLILAGGGARSSFQIGAMHRMISVDGLKFDAVTGTSAGAILGATIAQYSDHSGQHQAVEDLTRIWRELTGPAELFTERSWFALLQDRAPIWQKILRSDAASHAPWTIELPALGWPFRRGITGPTTLTLPQLPHAFTTLSDLWTVAGPGSGIESIARGVLTSSSIFTPGPLVDRLLAEVFDPKRLAASQVPVRFAVVSLESGELRYVDQHGQLRDRNDTALGITVDIIDAIAASCAIPAVFPPVRLGEEHYVDGGVRMNLPADIMLEHLPVDTCYAICNAPCQVQPVESFAQANIVSTTMRSAAALMNDELARQELARAHQAGVIVIEPQIEVHDAMTVTPGLIKISMEYGYLRAAQVLSEASAAEQETAQRLIELRRLAWALTMQEELVHPMPGMPDPAAEIIATAGSAMSELDPTQLRSQIRELTTVLPAEHLPAEAELWGKPGEFASDLATQ